MRKKKKPKPYKATHELGELLVQAAAEMEAQEGWDQHGERPTDVARAFAALLFETAANPAQADLAETRPQNPFHSDPHILGGTPVFVNTHVPVAAMFNSLQAGASIDTFLDQHSAVTREVAIATLKAASQLVDEDAYFAACMTP